MNEVSRYDGMGDDIDWFGCDKNGRIVMVASGGGILPESIVELGEEVRLDIRDHILSLPILPGNDYLAEKTQRLLAEIQTQYKKDWYLKDLIMYVSRGIYYYDKAEVANFGSYEYFLKGTRRKQWNPMYWTKQYLN